MQPVANFENNYMISKSGEITTIKTGKQKIPTLNKKLGYFLVQLYTHNKGYTKYVHRLVAETYIPNPSKKEEVNHINGDKQDNRVENLEWVTRSENSLHAYKIGLSAQHRRLGDSSLNNVLKRFIQGETITALAEELNIGLSRLSINLRRLAQEKDMLEAYTNELRTQKIQRNTEANANKRQSVEQYTKTGEYIASYVSLRQATRALGKSSSGTISNALNEKHPQKTAYGYKWRLTD